LFDGKFRGHKDLISQIEITQACSDKVLASLQYCDAIKTEGSVNPLRENLSI
jgi:hypothetical protein